MIALVTGASSGIGRDMALYLSKLGYDLILVARSENKLQELQKEIQRNNKKADIFIKDLSKEEECISLYNEVKEKFENIDILINNAGFGLCGEFVDTDLEKEISMINTNMTALHILTKLFLKDMVKNNKGNILNVASVAAFMPGPLMATYYSSKAYVLRLSQAINEELKRKKSKVKISILCPGPVDTNFNDVANVKFSLKGISSEYVAKYAIDKMLKGKTIISVGIRIKLVRFFSKILPDRQMERICYNVQEQKIK